MFQFIGENLATLGVSLLLALCVAASITHMVKAKKAGKSVCGCSCKGCPMDCSCKHDN